jgi:hypothetical protein
MSHKRQLADHMVADEIPERSEKDTTAEINPVRVLKETDEWHTGA